MNIKFEYPLTFVFLFFVYTVSQSQILHIIPESSKECQKVTHSYFSLCYCEENEQAYWVSYMLTSDMVKNKQCERSDNFRPDPFILTGSASLADYKGSGYDRGHLCPAADMNFNCIAMSETFYMSNMSPQFPSFNRGIWNKLEAKVREWALEYDTIYIITAGILDTLKLGSIGKNNVTVPAYFYKAIYREKSDDISCIALIIPNEGSQKPIIEFVVRTDSLENIIKGRFYTHLSDSIQSILKKNTNISDWKW